MTDKELREMGVEDAYARKDILEALKKENAAGGELQKAYEEAVAELEAAFSFFSASRMSFLT